MNEYTPDSWVILRIDQPKLPVFYKVLAGWSGGYLDGDSWKLNSGITKIDFDGEYYSFSGWSGSVYKCHKNSETMRMSTAGIWAQLQEAYPDYMKIVSVDDIELPEET